MRIFSLYMAQRFFKPFFFGLGLFAILIFLGDMFDKMNYLVRSKAPLGIILEYLWLQVPYWTIRIIPMATLLATLVAITGFVQSGEWIAVQAAGFETRDFWKPVLWCSLIVTLVSFATQETVLPACYHRARQLWEDRIHPEWEWISYRNIAVASAPDEFIRAQVLSVRDGLMTRPIIEITGPGGIERQLDAQTARWDPGRQRWILFKGVDRRFEKGALRQEPFLQMESDLSVPPRSLLPLARNPDEMSLREMRRYSARMGYLGVSSRELQVAVHNKIAYPFTNLIICALGIPVALRLRSRAKVVSFCAAMSLSFLYLWFIEVGRALGNGGQVPPAVAAWSANLLFAGLALWLIRRYGD